MKRISDMERLETGSHPLLVGEFREVSDDCFSPSLTLIFIQISDSGFLLIRRIRIILLMMESQNSLDVHYLEY